MRGDTMGRKMKGRVVGNKPGPVKGRGRTVSNARHPWEKWFGDKGSKYLIIQGTEKQVLEPSDSRERRDYSCSHHSMDIMIRQKAAQKGLRVSVHKHYGDVRGVRRQVGLLIVNHGPREESPNPTRRGRNQYTKKEET